MIKYLTQVHNDANELIEAGRALSNAGYFMKRVLREQELAKKYIDKHNAKLYKEARIAETVAGLQSEIDRLEKLLAEKKVKA